MNIVPEVIVIIMSVVVLSLVHLRSFLFFFRFGGRQSSRIVCTENKKGEEKRRRDLSLSLSLSLRGSKKRKMNTTENRELKDEERDEILKKYSAHY